MRTRFTFQRTVAQAAIFESVALVCAFTLRRAGRGQLRLGRVTSGFLTLVVWPATSSENERRASTSTLQRSAMYQPNIESDVFIPPRLDDSLSRFSPETRRAARKDALPVPRQLLLLNLLDQADAIARGTACMLTLVTHSECDAQEEGSVALQGGYVGCVARAVSGKPGALPGDAGLFFFGGRDSGEWAMLIGRSHSRALR